MATRFATGFILILLPLILCAKGQNNAYQFVSNLYSHYYNDTTGFSSINPKSADTIFSPELLDLMRLNEKQEQEGLGYDPICDCQDDDGFKMGKIYMDTRNGTTSAKIKFNISDIEYAIQLNLISKNDKWFVDDVITSRGSLRDLLKKNVSSN